MVGAAERMHQALPPMLRTTPPEAGEERFCVCRPMTHDLTASPPQPPLAVWRVQFQIAGYLALPAVAVREQFFLVVIQFFPGFGRIFEVRTFHDRIDRAGLLA